MSLQKHCASYATTMVTTLLYKGMGYIPPAEAEANYYRQLETSAVEPALT